VTLSLSCSHVRTSSGSQLRLDWTLLWYGLQNALSNARKYGDPKTVEIALEYREPTLVLLVTNGVLDAEAQARTIGLHGADATELLHRRVDGAGSQSTNLGGKALRTVASLLEGRVSLHLEPSITRLRLEVTAPRHVDVKMSDNLLVYFIDDDATLRVQFDIWIDKKGSPLDPRSLVFPSNDLSPEDADEAMRGFATTVLEASPRPRACVLDQHLRSQVEGSKDATTGTALAKQLRAGGYEGVIIIRPAIYSHSSLLTPSHPVFTPASRTRATQICQCQPHHDARIPRRWRVRDDAQV